MSQFALQFSFKEEEKKLNTAQCHGLYQVKWALGHWQLLKCTEGEIAAFWRALFFKVFEQLRFLLKKTPLKMHFLRMLRKPKNASDWQNFSMTTHFKIKLLMSSAA